MNNPNFRNILHLRRRKFAGVRRQFDLIVNKSRFDQGRVKGRERRRCRLGRDGTTRRGCSPQRSRRHRRSSAGDSGGYRGRKKATRKSIIAIVVGSARVMSYEDIVEVQKQRNIKDAAAKVTRGRRSNGIRLSGRDHVVKN
jgi:hypothetical protein